MSNKMFAISIELPSAPWRCGQDHGSRGLPGSACRSRVRGRAPLRVMSTLACCRAQPPCNHRKRARTKDEDPNGKQTRDGYAMGYLCARPDVENNEEYKTTQNHREILVASTRIHGRRSSNNPCKCSIYTSGRIMRVTKRPILPSQERTCLRLFRSAILSHCLRKDTHLPAKLKAQHVPYHTI